MMRVRTVYSTNNGMNTPGPAMRNAFNCALAVGAGPDGNFSVHVVHHTDESAFAILDREELRALRDAISRELADA